MYANSYFLFTSLDVRQYDGLNGRLKQVYSNLTDV